MKGSSLLTPIAKRLEGKVALITGGASDIGESSARLFAQHGAKVVVVDIQEDLALSLCKNNSNSSNEAISFVHCDVTNDSDIENAVNTTVSKHGKLDIVFSNAGILSNMNVGIFAVDHEDFKRVFDVNVFGALLATKHATKVMLPTKKGSIVFTSSLASGSAVDEVPHTYAASKHAVVGLTKNLCVELGRHRRVNCISPFVVATPFLRKILVGMQKEKVEELISEAANLKEVKLEAIDVAEAALYLGSDKPKYVSGLNLAVDGGYSATNTAFREALKMWFS